MEPDHDLLMRLAANSERLARIEAKLDFIETASIKTEKTVDVLDKYVRQLKTGTAVILFLGGLAGVIVSSFNHIVDWLSNALTGK